MRRQFVGACAALLTLACSSLGGGGGASEPAPATPAAPVSPWQVGTSYVLDLWLHGYAMVQRDTSEVPYFRRGYREMIASAKSRRGVTTQLDANATTLQRGFDANPGLVSGQFLGLQERNWEEMQADITAFLEANGDPRAARDSTMRPAIAAYAQSFPRQSDREWLRLFAQSLADENTRFYQQYWNDRQHELAPVLARVDSLFTKRYFQALRGYLNNSQLDKGVMLLSLPLDGEGRTITSQHTVAVIFPSTPDSAMEAVYTFVHEAAGLASGQAVSDNTTPNEKQSGAAARYESAAAVRTGAALLRRTAPDLVTGYDRYYLRAARGRVTSSDVESEFERAFPLPQAMLDAINKQIDRLLSTI
ncbi:MAG: hypothetical protein ABI889_14580 [Gemmatimonadota bacterium]